MNSRRQIEQIEKIAKAAAEAFILTGYRRTQVVDIARKSGIAPGTIYLYFQSKEALFDFVVRYTADPLSSEQWPDIPIPAPPLDSTIDFVTMPVPEIFPTLFQAVQLPCQPDPRGELEQVIAEMYNVFFIRRHYIKLMDRCSWDWPRLAEVWTEGIKRKVLEALDQYIQNRITQRAFLAVPDTWASARFIVEVLNWFATQRPEIPSITNIDDETAKDMVTLAVTRLLIPGT